MPIGQAPLIAKGPVVYFGKGDLLVEVAGEVGGPVDCLLIYQTMPGPIGLDAEVGREAERSALHGGTGASTENAPADLAMHFSRPEAVDQVIIQLQRIKASLEALNG